MPNFTKSYKILFVFILMISACSEEETLSQKDLLSGTSSKEWLIQDYVDVGVNWSSQPTCVRDDAWVFFSNGDMQQNEGISKCAPGDPQIYVNGLWQLNESTNILTLIRDTTMSWTVDQLTANTLVIKSGTTKITFTAK